VVTTRTDVDVGVRIIRKTDAQRYTLGIVYEPNVVDTQGDWSTAEEIEKACYGFMRLMQGKGKLVKAAMQLLGAVAKAAETGETVRLDVTGLAEEIAKAGGPINDMHAVDFEGETPDVVQCYIAPTDFDEGDQHITKGTWLMGVVWPEDYFAKIQSGERTGYSMEGQGRRVEEDAPKETG